MVRIEYPEAKLIQANDISLEKPYYIECSCEGADVCPQGHIGMMMHCFILVKSKNE